MGQSGFPSNTVVNCYGSDSTCTGASTPHSDPNQILYNPCCFTISDPSDPVSISALNSGFYTVSDGPCQSCTGEHYHLQCFMLYVFMHEMYLIHHNDYVSQ